jgi:arylformamidase
MKFIDLSHPLRHGQKTFPMDPKLSIVPHSTTKDLKYNMTQVTLGTHQGTHLDAMYHFLDAGKTIEQMPLEWFYGSVTVLRLPKKAGEEVTLADLQRHESSLQPEAKIIYETGWHRQFGQENYFTEFPSLTLEAARYLASRKIRLLGMDTPTPSRDWFEIHHILLGAEIVLVESLARLDQTPDQFTLSCFPLNFEGRDGSPVRAVALV